MKPGLIILALLLLSFGVASYGSDSLSRAEPQPPTGADTLSQQATADSTAAGLEYPISPERMSLLISYSRFNNIWRFVSFTISVVILLLILFTGLSAGLRNLAARLTGKTFARYFFYFLFFSIVMFIINFPVDYYRGYVIEHRYGFSNQQFGSWFGDSMKSLAVSIVFGFPVVLILYWLINRFKRWWLYFAIGMIPIIFFIILIAPVVIDPLFNEFKPVSDPQVAGEMKALAEKAGIHNPDILEIDASRQSSKVNAYFAGLFGTRRIVLYDTTIKNFKISELKFVTGHEIGHYLLNHLWYGALLIMIFILLAGYLADRWLRNIIKRYDRRWGFQQLGDMASLPAILLFLTVLFFFIQPVGNAVSRHFEYQSDRFGLELSGVAADDAVTSFEKLSVANLSDPEPPALIEFWFYSHPSLKKRIDHVLRVYHEIHPEGS